MKREPIPEPTEEDLALDIEQEYALKYDTVVLSRVIRRCAVAESRVAELERENEKLRTSREYYRLLDNRAERCKEHGCQNEEPHEHDGYLVNVPVVDPEVKSLRERAREKLHWMSENSSGSTKSHVDAVLAEIEGGE